MKYKNITFFIASLVLMVILSLTPTEPVQASWFEAGVFSAIGSFFSGVKSLVVNLVANTGSTNCIPPVSPKPATNQHALGTMIITPEISEETKDDTILVSLVPKIDSLTVELTVDRNSPYRGLSTFRKGNIVDWGPKLAELPKGGKGINFTMDDNSIRWETQEYYDDNNRMLQKRPRLPAQTYWAKLKVEQTTPWASDENTGSYGWKEIQYNIHYIEGAETKQENFKTVSGKSMYYVGGPQYPTGKIVRVGNTVDYGKLVTVKAGEPLEVEGKPTGWQGGTMTINPGPTAHVIGPKNITVKAGESAVWKILPRGTYPVKGKIEIKNKCNEIFEKEFPKRFLSPSTTNFENPIKFDFNGVSKEKMRLAFQGGAFVLDFGKPQSSLNIISWLSLIDEEVVVAPAPDQKIILEAVYKDNPKEIAKNILIAPEGKSEQAGKAQSTTGKEGTVRFKVRASNITNAEVSRGIILKESAPDIFGLKYEIELLFTGIVIDITKPQPVPKIENPPPAQNKTEKISVKELKISSDRKLDGLKEGDKVNFKAIAVMSNGTEKEVKLVQWLLIGKVGSINENGVFAAKLHESIAEYGEGIGTITATYIDDATGKTFLGTTPTFKVESFAPESSEIEG